MKKIILLFIVFVSLILVNEATAQNYTSLEWDLIRLGYVIPSGVEGVGAGLAVGSEVRYNITDRISAGLKGEVAIYSSTSDLENASVGAAVSTLLTGDYYFNTTSSRRLFAGIGIGQFGGASAKVDDEDLGTAGSAFGVAPRVGYELGHLRLAVEYNLPFKNTVSKYFGIQIAGTIGGGYKK
jgi:hypothetical protein